MSTADYRVLRAKAVCAPREPHEGDDPPKEGSVSRAIAAIGRLLQVRAVVSRLPNCLVSLVANGLTVSYLARSPLVIRFSRDELAEGSVV